MANLSQIKRDRMKDFLENLKQTNTSDEQIRAINEIENFLDEKRYGLVWEEHEEKVDVIMQDSVPIFKEIKGKSIVTNPEASMNFILEGDNLHSLNLLEKTHKGKIDIIYIDPPYNTNNSLTYDDSRVGEEDAFRHSMWLSFMSERLWKAKSLLSKRGLIFISIDDNEGYNLKILCDEIFDQNNFMGSFSITKAEGGGQAKYIVKGHDLLLIYAANLTETQPLGRPKDVRGQTFEKEGEIYWIQEDAYRKVFGKYGNLHYEEILEYRDQSFKDEVDQKISIGEIKLLDKGPNGMHVLGKVRKLSDDYSKYHSVMKMLNASGKADLAAFGLDDLFDYPKPVNLIKELISGAAFLRPGKLIVLDFFAGSGTTGQAVLEFLKETGRDVEFILCTNNEVSAKQKLNFVKALGYLENYKPGPQTTDSAIENTIEKELAKYNTSIDAQAKEHPDLYESYGICQAVTYQRVKKVIKGFDWQSKGTKILYKKKLSERNLGQMNDFLEEIERRKKIEGFEEYKVKIDDNSTLILEASVSKGEHYNAIEANLKYFKTDFVPKQLDEDEALSVKLMDCIKEMVELDFGVDLDSTTKCKLIYDESELDEFFDVNLVDGTTLFVPTCVLMKGIQEHLAAKHNITIIRVPDYYFSAEIREVGEL